MHIGLKHLLVVAALFARVDAHAQTCIDPDLSKISSVAQVMLCDGTLTTGTATFLPDCTENLQTNCIARGNFRAHKPTTLSPKFVQRGKTVGKVTGTMWPIKQCRNAANLSLLDFPSTPSNLPRTFVVGDVNTGTEIINLNQVHVLTANYPVKFTSTNTLPAPLVVNTTYYVIVATTTSIQLATTSGGAAIDLTSTGTGTHTIWPSGDGVAGAFDTVDEYVNGSTVGAIHGPWGEDYVCDASNFKKVSGDGHPTPTNTIVTNANRVFDSIWQDELTGLYVTNALVDATGSGDFIGSLALCDSLNGTSAGTGWRVPTQKEFMQLYVNGITRVPLGTGYWPSSSPKFRTSTTSASDYRSSFYMTPATGRTGQADERGWTTSYGVICVR